MLNPKAQTLNPKPQTLNPTRFVSLIGVLLFLLAFGGFGFGVRVEVLLRGFGLKVLELRPWELRAFGAGSSALRGLRA